MPRGFASEKQRRFLWATNPTVAQKIYDDSSPSQRAKNRKQARSTRKSSRAHRRTKRKARR